MRPRRVAYFSFGLLRAWLIALVFVPPVWLVGRAMSFRPVFSSLAWLAIFSATVVYTGYRALRAPVFGRDR